MNDQQQDQGTSRNLHSHIKIIQKQIQQLDNQFSIAYQLFFDYFKCIILFFSFVTIICFFIFYCNSASNCILYLVYYQKNQNYSNSSSFEEFLLTTTILTTITNQFQCYNISQFKSSLINSSTIKIIFKPSFSTYDYANGLNIGQLIQTHPDDTNVCLQMNQFEVVILDKRFSIQQIKQIYMIIDGIIIFLILISLVTILYRDHKIHVTQYRPQIRKYSCEISNLPMLPKYILLPKLKQYIQKTVKQKYQLLWKSTQQAELELDFFQIFDIETSFTEKQIQYYYMLQKYNYLILDNKYSGLFKTQFNPTQFKEYKLKLQQTYTMITSNQDSKTQIVWVTFSSRKSYFYFKQTFKHNIYSWKIAQYFQLLINKCEIKQFEGKILQVKQAPQPLQINWKNIYVNPLKRYLTRFIIYIMCGLLILGFDTIIILTYKNLKGYQSAILILILNKILIYILGKVQNYEGHKLFTNQQISNLKKLIICEYINTGLIALLSNYKFQNTFFIFFSRNKYDAMINKQWICDVGLTIMFTFLLNIIISNVDIFFLPIVKLLKQLYYKFIQSETISKTKTFKQYMQIFKKNQVKLHEYYSQSVTMIMVCLTYSYILPILYPIIFCSLLTNFSSYKFLIKYMLKKPCYNNDKLNITSCKFIYGCIILHVFIIWQQQNSQIHQFIFIILIVLYFTKQYLLKHIISFIQRYLGPLFSNLVSLLNHEKKMKSIDSIFSSTQKQQKISELQKRKNIIKQQLINSKIYLNQAKQFWLKKYLKILDIQHEKVFNFKPAQNGLIGSISYSKINLLNTQTND